VNITIKTIPHKEQRYDTVGDWQFTDAGDLTISVSEMGDWRYEALVAFHELAEVLLCKARNILQQDVDAFDFAAGNYEPGDSPDSPYYREHFFATTVERMLCTELGVDWHTYDEAVAGV
jgi:hypothetical protein